MGKSYISDGIYVKFPKPLSKGLEDCITTLITAEAT